MVQILMLCLVLGGARFDAHPLARWEGRWSGEGKFFGQAATQRIEWQRVLGGKFLRLTMRVEARGKPVFEGHAYYRATAVGKYEARWFDSQGHIYPINAQHEDDVLTAWWGEPSLEEGKSTYRVSDAGQQLEVVDAVHNKDGTWREFGRFTLKRAVD